MLGLNRTMLPANVDGEHSPVTHTKRVNGVPVSIIVTQPPKLLETKASTPSPKTEKKQETDANQFPILRGFV